MQTLPYSSEMRTAYHKRMTHARSQHAARIAADNRKLRALVYILAFGLIVAGAL